jgi:hypothetical protein
VILQGQTPPPTPMLPFDPNQLIPLIGMIGGMIVAGVVLYAFFKSDLAKAMAERLDFAERLLAQKRERSLPGA